MPYASDKQRAWMHIHEPEIAERWDREMKDNTPEGYSNSRNFDADTFEDYREESAVPFVSPDPQDPHTEATWGSTGDAEFAATAMAVFVEADGSTTTRGKAGQANQSGPAVNPAV